MVCFLALTLANLSCAQNSPKGYLNPHNAALEKVRVGSIKWDANLAAYAMNYANKLKGNCKLVHSGCPYGENLAWSSGDLTGTPAVNLWVEKSPSIITTLNSCVGGECRHYTQVVWRNYVRLGCAKVRCNNGGTIISCNYDPRGNIVGQRPY